MNSELDTLELGYKQVLDLLKRVPLLILKASVHQVLCHRNTRHIVCLAAKSRLLKLGVVRHAGIAVHTTLEARLHQEVLDHVD